MRMTPSKKPLSEIVCLVDDDPLALRSTGFKQVLIGSTAERVMRRANRSVLVVPSHPGLRKLSNQKNGTRLMERLIPQTLSDAATRLVESLKMNSISEKVRRGHMFLVKQRNIHWLADLANLYFRMADRRLLSSPSLNRCARTATGPISPSSNVECLDTAHFFPDCSLAAPVPNVLPFCL